MSSDDQTHGTAILSLVPDSSIPTLKCVQSWLPDTPWSLPDDPEVKFESFGVAFEPFPGSDPEVDILNMLTCPAGPDSIRRSLIDGLKSGEEWALNWFKRRDGSLVQGTPRKHEQGEAPCIAPLIPFRSDPNCG